MAAARVQSIGAASNGTTATVLTVTKTITSGNTIIVGGSYFVAAGAESVTDNLGNTYTKVEGVTHGGTNTTTLWYAPITTGGALTTITFNHPSTVYNSIVADEFSGVGTLATAGGGTGTTGTSTQWDSNKTIPANGLAVGVVISGGTTGVSAGAASGSPSTSLALGSNRVGGTCVSLIYAIPGTSDVTAFTGTGTVATSASLAGAGGNFNPASLGSTFVRVDALLFSEVQTILVTPNETLGIAEGTATPTFDAITAKTASDSIAIAEAPTVPTVPLTPSATPTLTVRIDWNNDGDFSDTYEDLEGRVLGCTWTRGRSADFSAEATGSATITLRNDDDLYTPNAAGGPTVDQLVPGRPVHIYSTYLGVDYPQFYGYIERLSYDPRERTVIITCYDPLRRLSETDVVMAANSYISRSARDMRIAVLDDFERGDRNLIHNPSFETDVSDWSVGAGITFTRITSDHVQGSACAQLVATALDEVGFASRLAPVFFAGKTYRFSVYLRGNAGNEQVLIGIGNTTKTVTLTTSWVRYTITAAPATDTSGNSGLMVRIGPRAISTIYIDAASLTRGQALYPYSDTGSGRWPNWCGNGSFDGGILNGWYDGWTNLVANPSFETDTTGWSVAADAFHDAAASITRSTAQSKFGAASGLVDRSGGNQGAHYALSGTFKSGVTYDVRVWVRRLAGTSPFFMIGIGSNGTPTDKGELSGQTYNSSEWRSFTVAWAPIADRTDAHVYARDNDGGADDFYLDGVQVTRRDPIAIVGPLYAGTGPGGGGSFNATRTLSTTAKYGNQAQSVATPATATAGRVYDFNHLGSYFVSGQAYTASVWVRPTSSMPYKVGLAANKGDGTFDEASATGTATANIWTQVTVTWTPSADRSSASPFNVVLYVMQTDTTARTFLIDGVRVIPGSSADDFEMTQWQLDAEPDLYLTSAALSGSALSGLSTLNGYTLSRHYIKPTMASPWYAYITTARSSTKTSVETFDDDLADMTQADIDRASIINVVPVAYSGGIGYYSDEASVLAYGSRPTGSIGSADFLPDLTVPDLIGPALLARYKDPRARPEITIENRWPSQLQRELDDLVTVNFARLSISGGRYLILRLTATVSQSGSLWRTVYAIEESA